MFGPQTPLAWRGEPYIAHHPAQYNPRKRYTEIYSYEHCYAPPPVARGNGAVNKAKIVDIEHRQIHQRLEIEVGIEGKSLPVGHGDSHHHLRQDKDDDDDDKMGGCVYKPRSAAALFFHCNFSVFFFKINDSPRHFSPKIDREALSLDISSQK